MFPSPTNYCFFLWLVRDCVWCGSQCEGPHPGGHVLFVYFFALMALQVCCAAFGHDETWHRAVIVDFPEEDLVKVQYLDYGDTLTIRLADVKELRYVQCRWGVEADLPLIQCAHYHSARRTCPDFREWAIMPMWCLQVGLFSSALFIAIYMYGTQLGLVGSGHSCCSTLVPTTSVPSFGCICCFCCQRGISRVTVSSCRTSNG